MGEQSFKAAVCNFRATSGTNKMSASEIAFSQSRCFCHSQGLMHEKWLHGIVKCLLDTHFRISPQVVSHPGTFPPLFYEYCFFRHASFSHTFFCLYYIVGKYAHSGAAKAGFQTGSPKIPLVFHFSEKQVTSQTLHTVALWYNIYGMAI